MPLVLDSVSQTTTISVPQPALDKAVLLNRIVIYQVSIDLPPNDITQTKIVANWARGYTDDDGQFQTVETSSSQISGAELLTAMGAPVNEGLSHYADFKKTIYEILQARGDIPAGQVA